MDKIMDREPWIGTKELCRYLSINRHTIMAWIKDKNMPAYRVGGGWRFRISEIDAWIEAQQDEEQVGE